jgi:hypothetical protein
MPRIMPTFVRGRKAAGTSEFAAPGAALLWDCNALKHFAAGRSHMRGPAGGVSF